MVVIEGCVNGNNAYQIQGIHKPVFRNLNILEPA